MARVGFRQRVLDDIPAPAALFGLKRFPKPAAIGDRRGWKLRPRRGRQRTRGTFFRPLQCRVQRIAVEALKRLNAHPRIDQHIVDQLGMHHHRLRRGGGCEPENGNDL
jgi:hypothetical protein